jgi:uncharacterized protein (TIGR03435 family)
MHALPSIRVSALAAMSVAVLAPPGLLAQPAASSLSFEVASVKPAGPQENALGRGLFTFPGGRVGAYKCTLEKLIEEAFSLQPFQLAGGPNWIHEDRYNVEAKPPASSQSRESNPTSPKSPPNDEQRQMLQTLLTNRFQLKYHRESKEGAVYLLVKGNKDLKLQDARNRDDYSWVGGLGGGVINGDGLWGINASMPQLASRLSAHLEHPVLDRTELKGFFDFKYEYRTDDPRPDIISSILASVQGIGLKLETGKGPVEMLTIDRAERPSEN